MTLNQLLAANKRHGRADYESEQLKTPAMADSIDFVDETMEDMPDLPTESSMLTSTASLPGNVLSTTLGMCPEHPGQNE